MQRYSCLLAAPLWLLAAPLWLLGCSGDHVPTETPPKVSTCVPQPGPVPQLVINEVVTRNDGLAIDETGQTADYIELGNRGPAEVALWPFTLSDAKHEQHLPAETLAPGARIVLWADGDTPEGPHHLSFSLSGSGEQLSLWDCDRTLDEVKVPALGENQVYARFPDLTGPFALCDFATTGQPNGKTCSPPLPVSAVIDETYLPYQLPTPYPALPDGIALSELALRPARFIELVNLAKTPRSLAGLKLELAHTAPGLAWPKSGDGQSVSLPDVELLPGEHRTVPLTSSALTAIAADPLFEGVVTLRDASGSALDRLDFMRWPDNSVLARSSRYASHGVFCAPESPGAANDGCVILAKRDVGDRVRHLRTLGDFAALSEGNVAVGISPIKFVMDIAHDGVVHLLSNRQWSLHYDWIRQVIDGRPALDRCDPVQRAEFNQGWLDFSRVEYYVPLGRHYLLGTLVHHGPTDLHTLEFAQGDAITPADMSRAFYAVMEHVLTPSDWALHPGDAEQVAKAKTLSGQLPIVAKDAPFVGVTLQPLTRAVGYGELQFHDGRSLKQAPLGVGVIVVTDAVPNELPPVGGLITEAFQTPLSHVNVLSQSRGSPNLALINARQDPRVLPLLGKLVRFEVTPEGFTLREASSSEAAAFWDSKRPPGKPTAARLDTDSLELMDLEQASSKDLPRIGAKAAQLAELEKVLPSTLVGCAATPFFATPERAFAVPLGRFIEHANASGALKRLRAAEREVRFDKEPDYRQSVLSKVQAELLAQPVDKALLKEIQDRIRIAYGTARVRFRSSSNTEDLSGFNGAGLYQSLSAELDNTSLSVEDSLRQVWSSLMSPRAYEERRLANIDQSTVAMGVLVHRAFTNERANGVAVSRDLLEPNRGDLYYINAQAGEASVTNPAPGVSSDALVLQVFQPSGQPDYQAHSTLIGDRVLSDFEARAISCGLYAVSRHFAALLDPTGENPYFTMEVEWKLLGPERSLLFKQARPFPLSGLLDYGDCRAL